MKIVLSIPFPVSANAMYRNAAKTLKSKEYRAWIKAAAWTVATQTRTRITGPYKLTLLAVPPDKRRRDIDNLLKSTNDVLKTAGVIDDDSQCRWIEARWVETGEPCQLILELL